ncbi:MAG: phosphatase PAP2 family protein [Polyangiales bacterium]
MALGVVGVVKAAVGECRPRAWSDAAQRCVGQDTVASSEDRLAFPSGHTAPLAAMAGASLGMVLLPRGPRGAFVPLLGLTTALAGTNLVLRVVAGAHSWVDTAVGFSLGFGVGFVTALLHTGATTPPRVSFGASPGGLSVRGVF